MELIDCTKIAVCVNQSNTVFECTLNYRVETHCVLSNWEKLICLHKQINIQFFGIQTISTKRNDVCNTAGSTNQ